MTFFVAMLQTMIAGSALARANEQNPFHAEVLDVRPRVFLRNEPFEGLTVEKLRDRLHEPEFSSMRHAWRTRPLGRGLLWLLEGTPEDLAAAVAGLDKMNAANGTWSDRGLALVRLATLFDWLYDDLDQPTRERAIHKIEHAAEAAARHVRRGEAPFFYSRTPSALAGLCTAGLALSGVSEKAESYLQTFREFGVNEYFQAYQWVDGAATGATYTLHYTYTALPSICAAWWSATDDNPADWIRVEQGDWLDGIVRFYLWYMRPGFAFTAINDQFRGNWQSHDQFCQGLDIATYVTRNGYGRTWSTRWLGRFGPTLYHPAYAHHYIFRDPTLASRSLTELPLAELFGRESCGYGFFRSDWPKDDQPDLATHVFFRCGDPMDVHGGVAAGEFQLFRHAPLAARSGRYSSYDSPPDQYHRNCISTNVVLFTDPTIPGDRGDQNTRRGLKTDHATWAEWLRIRERHELDVAKITNWQVLPGEARCRADLTGANPSTKCRQWVREFVWLANKHLVVLDIVQTATPEIRRQWQLHATSPPELGNQLLTITCQAPEQAWADPTIKPQRTKGRLFCQTIFPLHYRLLLHHDQEAEAFAPCGSSLGPVEGNTYHRQYGRVVMQIEPEDVSTQTIFLHVLTAVSDAEGIAPQVTYQVPQRGTLVLSVDDTSTRLEVPEWFDPAR
jgi:hypothetical protein